MPRELSSSGIRNTKITTVALAQSPYTVSVEDLRILLNASGGALVINLPAISTAGIGTTFIFDDLGSASAINTITINRAGADLIDGAASQIISTPYASIKIVAVTATLWKIE